MGARQTLDQFAPELRALTGCGPEELRAGVRCLSLLPWRELGLAFRRRFGESATGCSAFLRAVWE